MSINTVEKVYKFAVIKNDCNSNTCSILHTTIYEYDAIDYLTKYINNSFVLDNFQKAYYENNKTICIFKYHYFLPKNLIYKFQIIEFADPLLCETKV